MRNSFFQIGFLVAVFAVTGVAQTVAPPVAEYRNKANGIFELRNDGDTPLAAVLEIHGFAVDEAGTLTYKDLSSDVKVELGASSFVIPPHQSHYVFYKASTSSSQAWFTILSTLTKASSAPGKMRINFILPHVVYIYQKQKLKKQDVSVHLKLGQASGEYTLEIENHSNKLSRVESVSGQGFEKSVDMGGFPIFPEKKRHVVLNGGSPSADTKVKVSFEDGFSVQVPLS
jgi:hypothetical protein